MLIWENETLIARDDEVFLFRVDGDVDYILTADETSVREEIMNIKTWETENKPKIAIDKRLLTVLRGRGCVFPCDWASMGSLSELVGEEFAIIIIEDWRENDPEAEEKLSRPGMQLQ